MFVTPGNGIAVQWRSAQGGPSSQLVTTGTVPAYLMVGRYTTGGQTYYTAYTSPDGSTWTAIPGSTQALAMTGALLAGFAVTSHNQGTAVGGHPGHGRGQRHRTPPARGLPQRLELRRHRHRTSGPGQPDAVRRTWNVTGFGNDIWGTADSFHFV